MTLVSKLVFDKQSASTAEVVSAGEKALVWLYTGRESATYSCSIKVSQSQCLLPSAAVKGNCTWAPASRMRMGRERWGTCHCQNGHTSSSTGTDTSHQMHLQDRLQQSEVQLQEAWHWLLCCMWNLQRHRVCKHMSCWKWWWWWRWWWRLD